MKASSQGIGGFRSTFPNLSVGTYQRSVVWDGKQKALFIQSVLKDYPTGIIVLNKLSAAPTAAPSPGPAGLPGLPSHDIIDGQQRLTTLYEFLDNPLVYVTDWIRQGAGKAHKGEPAIIADVRSKFDELLIHLRPVKAGYIHKGAKRKELIAKVKGDLEGELKLKHAGLSPKNPAFVGLTDAVERLFLEVTQRLIVVEELDGWDTAEAEQMYHVVNTSGTDLSWWELLRVDRNFTHTHYASHGSYTTRHDDLVRDIANKYRAPARLKPYVTTNDSLWEALFALGEYVHYRFAGTTPSVTLGLLPSANRRLKVDGLGFRLVSTFLSHNIGRPAINQVPVTYDHDDVRRAIDALFDASDLLFDPSMAGAPGFALFWKYGRLRIDAIQSYPLVGLLVAAARLVAMNTHAKRGITLTRGDTQNLRSFSEELFREAICTTKWAGTGDAKLKEWLDSHFEAVRPTAGGGGVTYPGAIKAAKPTYDKAVWSTFVSALAPTGERAADRATALAAFWVQYLYDSVRAGCLPAAPAELDHIVPVQFPTHPDTTHPLNVAVVAARLNRLKARETISGWSSRADAKDIQEYSSQVLNGLSFTLGTATASTPNFIVDADHARLGSMLAARADVYRLAVATILPHWVSSGD